MPEIVPPVAVPEPAKPKRGRPKKVKESKPRGLGVIAATFGERGRIASRILPADQRKALETALRHKGSDTTALKAKIQKLQSRLAAIEGAAAVVEGFRAKLQRVADTLAGDETK